MKNHNNTKKYKGGDREPQQRIDFKNYKVKNLFTGEEETINLYAILENSKDLKAPTEEDLKKFYNFK